jgi:hypothetical protein
MGLKDVVLFHSNDSCISEAQYWFASVSGPAVKLLYFAPWHSSRVELGSFPQFSIGLLSVSLSIIPNPARLTHRTTCNPFLFKSKNGTLSMSHHAEHVAIVRRKNLLVPFTMSTLTRLLMNSSAFSSSRICPFLSRHEPRFILFLV